MRMGRFFAIAILGLGMSVAAVAQHSSSGHAGGSGGGGHFSGGFSGGSHGASGFSGGSHFSPSAPRYGSPGPAPRYGNPGGRYAGGYPSRPPIIRGGPTQIRRDGSVRANPPAGTYGRSTRAAITSARTSAARSANFRGNGNRGNHWHSRNGIRVYGYGPISPLGWWLGPYQFYPWLDADLSYDFWHDTGDTDDAIAMASTGANEVADAGTGYESGAEPPPFPNGGDPYADAPPDPDAPVGWTATQVDTGAPALTLVYKSGHTEQVANYVVSRSAVTVIDAAGVRSVPVAELDVPAMAKINSQAGLQLPEGLQP
jgi:hypothetical protein